MTNLKTKYDFKEVEDKMYDNWVEKGYFKSGIKKEAKPFTIVIPPPNITGKLHLGHAWDNTLQDIIIRRKRMQGYDTLYLPGMDHAGIATQAKIDERLKQQGISKFDLGREGFLKAAWQWKDEYSLAIRNQWKSLGLSLDYSKERFTLDEGLNNAVNHVFISLYNDGLIYRGQRIINWDPKFQTALSNIEVEHQESLSKLYYIKYPFVEKDGGLVIATTRPETMFADQALMVNPKDKRYQDLIGKYVYIPTTEYKIPIIADEYVEMDFGSGVVKVTPAHDPNDFEVGLRHNLSMPLCMNSDGTMNQLSHKYNGQDRFLCRENLLVDLKDLELLVKVEDHLNNIGYSERSHVMVEPRLSLQWFVKMDVLAEKALKSKTNWVPKRFKKTYINWMTNIQDWCISRQLWWGHRIPAWYKGDEYKIQVESPGSDWVQDEDVLDTWFSSALWPFSTLGWPLETEDLKRFYPTNVLVTGYDIIFFWVARMIFQAQQFTDQDPFETVLIHGLIRAEDGRKMSKSYGNGIDPIEVIEKYGVDSLRYFLTTNSSPGADLRFNFEKIESSWNFINKLWNIVRFITLNIKPENIDNEDFKALNLSDAWILSRLNQVIREVDYYYDKFEFGEVSAILYNFIWDEFANWYLEIAKVNLKDEKYQTNTERILNYVVKQILKLMHPFIPFVTEKLYLEVSHEESIVISDWPKPKRVYKQVLTDFNEFIDIVTKVRNLRAEYNVLPKKVLQINLKITDDRLKNKFLSNLEPLKKLLNAELSFDNEIKDSILLVSTYTEIRVLKADLVDLKAEIKLLEKQLLDLEQEISRSKGLLNNPNFVNKAKPEKVRAEQEKYENYLKQHKALEETLKKHER